MVIVELAGDKHFYMDGRLNRALEKGKKLLQKKDYDMVIGVDGRERSGKSVLAQQICQFMDPTFSHDRMCQTTTEFITKADKLGKGQAVCFDEAYVGLSNRAQRSSDNKRMVNFFQRCGQKNLFIVIVLPVVRELDPYIRDHRLKGLLHVYERKGKRGFWTYFDRHKLNLLLDYQKKFKFRYDQPKHVPYGRFYEQYAIDEKAYRKKKAQTMDVQESQIGKTRGDIQVEQRDALIKYLYQDTKHSLRDISRILEAQGVKMSHEGIREATNRVFSTPV